MLTSEPTLGVLGHSGKHSEFLGIKTNCFMPLRPFTKITFHNQLTLSRDDAYQCSDVKRPVIIKREITFEFYSFFENNKFH